MEELQYLEVKTERIVPVGFDLMLSSCWSNGGGGGGADFNRGRGTHMKITRSFPSTQFYRMYSVTIATDRARSRLAIDISNESVKMQWTSAAMHGEG